MNKILAFIPTYNERENVEAMCNGIQALGLPVDILFLDDNSPDGTGEILDSLVAIHKNVHVIHREGKLGIGSAHYDGIMWAYANRYETLITMDSDFTHPPERVGEILEQAKRSPNSDIVVGSRFMRNNSLPGWNILRRILTSVGHYLTRLLLGMRYDATGALRLYRLNKIPYYAFDTVHARGYAFFFESLYVFHANGYKILEFPISLPARTAGNSKMTFAEIKRSIRLLFTTFLTSKLNPDRFSIKEPAELKFSSGVSSDDGQIALKRAGNL